MEALALIIIFLTCAISYILIYKPKIYDPIEEVKNIYLGAQLITMLISGTLFILAKAFSKSKESLIKHLKIIILLSFVVIVVLTGMNITMNNSYNKEEYFAKTYQEEMFYEKNPNKQYLNFGMQGVQLLGEKETYINQNMEAYKYFKIKTVVSFCLQILIVILNVKTLFKVIKQEEKADRLNKDDKILYDEEENVKY